MRRDLDKIITNSPVTKQIIQEQIMKNKGQHTKLVSVFSNYSETSGGLSLNRLKLALKYVMLNCSNMMEYKLSWKYAIYLNVVNEVELIKNYRKNVT